ncbi:unnamed protein product [Anisakis simplex]|uniref:PHD-type domain-containing protein n=1 Tax=Anisakis simplex TaxID=6269 RepID=A0A0M3K0J3_ANISI|nr:unnamed protein product [Anisakis simplex]
MALNFPAKWTRKIVLDEWNVKESQRKNLMRLANFYEKNNRPRTPLKRKSRGCVFCGLGNDVLELGGFVFCNKPHMRFAFHERCLTSTGGIKMEATKYRNEFTNFFYEFAVDSLVRWLEKNYRRICVICQRGFASIPCNGSKGCLNQAHVPCALKDGWRFDHELCRAFCVQHLQIDAMIMAVSSNLTGIQRLAYSRCSDLQCPHCNKSGPDKDAFQQLLSAQDIFIPDWIADFDEIEDRVCLKCEQPNNLIFCWVSGSSFFPLEPSNSLRKSALVLEDVDGDTSKENENLPVDEMGNSFETTGGTDGTPSRRSREVLSATQHRIPTPLLASSFPSQSSVNNIRSSRSVTSNRKRKLLEDECDDTMDVDGHNHLRFYDENRPSNFYKRSPSTVSFSPSDSNASNKPRKLYSQTFLNTVDTTAAAQFNELLSTERISSNRTTTESATSISSDGNPTSSSACNSAISLTNRRSELETASHSLQSNPLPVNHGLSNLKKLSLQGASLFARFSLLYFFIIIFNLALSLLFSSVEEMASQEKLSSELMNNHSVDIDQGCSQCERYTKRMTGDSGRRFATEFCRRFLQAACNGLHTVVVSDRS